MSPRELKAHLIYWGTPSFVSIPKPAIQFYRYIHFPKSDFCTNFASRKTIETRIYQ